LNNVFVRALRHVGHVVINGIWRLGYASRFFALVLMRSAVSFRRVRLTIREIYFAGVLSLVIILVSGLFVGMVLGLQGFDTLQRYGSAEAVGTLVALSLVRELGPVVAALLFASRAGSAMTAEIGLMKATEQITALEMMAVDPIARIVGPRFWAGVISMPLLAALFSAMGIFGGYLIAVGEPALELIEDRYLANPTAANGDVRHAMTALRFYHEVLGLPVGHQATVADQGVHAVLLPVGGAFHSPLMASAISSKAQRSSTYSSSSRCFCAQ